MTDNERNLLRARVSEKLGKDMATMYARFIEEIKSVNPLQAFTSYACDYVIMSESCHKIIASINDFTDEELNRILEHDNFVEDFYNKWIEQNYSPLEKYEECLSKVL